MSNQSQHELLLVDDDTAIRQVFEDTFEDSYSVTTQSSAESAFDKLSDGFKPDLIITDVKMPGMSGLEFLSEVKDNFDYPVIVITGYATVEMAVEAMKEGAFDFVVKPFDFDELEELIERTLNVAEISDQLDHSYPALKLQDSDNKFITASEDLNGIVKIIKKVCDYQTNVLITGETGTGKELVAQAIHFNGKLKNKPFVAVNCAALPEKLLESEMFGYKKGAFTDASFDKKGKVQVADGGTLFLDEISEVSPAVQAKLLRLLQEGEVQPLGSEKTETVELRVIAATNKKIEQEVEAGKFRKDLFFRLNVVPIHLPPLRERKEEIEPLARYFVNKINAKYDLSKELSDKALNHFENYEWPGNIRELENKLERALLMSDKKTLQPDDLAIEPSSFSETTQKDVLNLSKNNFPTLEVLEKKIVRRALEITSNDKKETSELLGIHRSTLYRKMQRWGWED